jgi:hypothetical protein
MGEAKKRAFRGVMSAPPVSSVRRTDPAITGIRLRKIKAAGTSHGFRDTRPAAGRWLPAARTVTTAVFLVAFTGNPLFRGR